MSGPVPKRSTQRRRVNKTGVKQVPAVGRVEQPAAPDDWGQLPRQWYESLAASGQAQFYEPSDWATAIVAGWLLDDWVSSRKAATMNEFRMLCGQLLATEGERRRGRLEIQRPGQDGPSKGDSVVAEYRAKLGVVS